MPDAAAVSSPANTYYQLTERENHDPVEVGDTVLAVQQIAEVIGATPSQVLVSGVETYARDVVVYVEIHCPIVDPVTMWQVRHG